MSDDEIGELLRWLCSIPLDSSLRITLTDGIWEMTFGASPHNNPGRVLNYFEDTLAEMLLAIQAERPQLEAWIACHSPPPEPRS